MDPNALIAKFIRQVVNNATVPSSDQFQQNLSAAKQWLEAIASGALVVQSPSVTKNDDPQTSEQIPC